jgi:hypothetical protein
VNLHNGVGEDTIVDDNVVGNDVVENGDGLGYDDSVSDDDDHDVGNNVIEGCCISGHGGE